MLSTSRQTEIGFMDHFSRGNRVGERRDLGAFRNNALHLKMGRLPLDILIGHLDGLRFGIFGIHGSNFKSLRGIG